MRAAILTFLFYILLCTQCIAIPFVVLDGNLSKQKMEKAKKTLSQNEENELAILINSSTGDLNAVLSFAKDLYTRKQNQQLNVVVFVDENAVGPSAIIPFLADELYTSIFVTWGDITYGLNEDLPKNILKSRVLSLTTENDKRGDLLTVMAEAMIDEDIMLIDNNGWQTYLLEKAPTEPIVKRKGEKLVVSHRQLRNLDLVTDEMSLGEFKEKFQIPKEVEIEPTLSSAVISEKESFVDRLKEHIKYNKEGENLVGRIIIEDQKSTINQGTLIHVKAALDHFKKVKPIFIILELNTPGGLVYSAQKISDALKEIDTQYDIPVVCYINNWAISAGAMIAYSCRFITISKDASMGAAEVVQTGGGEVKTASEKVNSAIRSEFANRAAFFGRDPLIAKAMVDKDMILVLRQGKFVQLSDKSQIRTSGPSPDILVSAEGKLLTLNARELIDYGVADLLMIPKKLPLITTKEREEGKWPGNKELLFQQEFFKEIPNPVISTFQPDWKTNFFSFLGNPFVSSMLLMGMIIGFYIEINTPGFGIPGSIGVACLLLLLLSSFAQEAANWFEVILMVAGLILIAVDVFMIPSFGIIGGIGILLFIGGLVAIIIPGLENIDYDFDTNSFNAAGEFAFERLAYLAGGLVVGLIVVALLGRYVFPRLMPYSRLILTGGEQDTKEGYFAGEDPSQLPKPGTEGEALTPLRPVGKVVFKEKIYEAMSDGEWIAKEEKVRITKLDGSVIIVEKM